MRTERDILYVRTGSALVCARREVVEVKDEEGEPKREEVEEEKKKEE